MESYKIVSANATTRSVVEGAVMLYTISMTAYCFKKSPDTLVLARLNLVGSVIWTLWYFSFLLMTDIESQALVCSFYGLCHAYYTTEFALFVNRTSGFYQMEPNKLKQIQRVGFWGLVAILINGALDFFTGTFFGVVAWNGADMGVYCYANVGTLQYGLLPLISGMLSFVGFRAVQACYKFVKSSSSAVKSNSRANERYLILKLMLASFSMTVFSAVFNVTSVLLSYFPLNYYLEHILAVASPIDTVLSLLLAIAVFHKSSAAKQMVGPAGGDSKITTGRFNIFNMKRSVPVAPEIPPTAVKTPHYGSQDPEAQAGDITSNVPATTTRLQDPLEVLSKS